MTTQVKIENLSPDVGNIEIVQDGEVIHTLAPGDKVTVNADDIHELNIRKGSSVPEETVAGGEETGEETEEESEEETTEGGEAA